MNSSWKPNPKAKPFLPSSAFYHISVPCKRTPLRVQKKGMLSRLIQWSLVILLCITVVINVLFILDTTSKLKDSAGSEDNVATANELPQGNSQVQAPERSQSNNAKISIEVVSSKEASFVSVDGTKVLEATEDKQRGINIAILNQASGAVMATRSFDTYATKEDSDALVLFINMVSDGRILCFSVKDEASMQVKKTLKNLMKMLGSESFDNVKWRDMWAFVVQKRGKVYAEGIHKTPNMDVWAKPLTVQATFPLQSKASSQCDWKEDELNRRRREFCNKYEGYGSVCSCTNPAPLDIVADPLPNGKRMELPVAVIASNRPQYLVRTIRSLLSAQGADPALITVYIDGFFQEPLDVARLFGLRGIQHTPVSSKNARISQHYKASLTTTFNLYPDVNYMIIVEEDLDLSTDFFGYFQQLVPLLDKDDSIYCISAWNDQGYEHTVGDPSMLYRIETMPGLGWVLKRKLYKEELEPNWPTPDKFWDWDMWMRGPQMRKERECIIPDMSRTYHFGTKGLNVHPLFQELYFKKHFLNTATDVKFDVDKMTKDNYENEIDRLLSSAEVLDHSKSACDADFVPDTQKRTYVFFIKMEHPNDWSTWNSLSKCLHIWDLDVRGFHKSMWRLWLKGNHVLIVGCPASTYCKHKPDNVTPIFLSKTEPPKQ